MSGPVSNNPNASLAAGSTGVGVVVIYLLGLLGVSLSPEVAVALGGGVTAALLFVGKNGLKGVWRVIWRGSDAG
jgi:hypothetical protein